MKVVAIIQARMGSTRLPGKILKKVLNKTLLEYQIERIQRAKTVDQIVIATTIKESDNEIVELCHKLDIPVYRGSEDDVLSRYYEAAKKYNAKVIVRLTSDCPLIDPLVIDKVVSYYLRNQDEFDYVSNTIERTYPRGLDTEVLPLGVLKQAYENAEELPYREHVTAYIYNHPEKYRLGHVKNIIDNSRYRWTVDTKQDFRLIENILLELYPKNKSFLTGDILNVLRDKPDWEFINKYVEQKKGI